jgi:hypothetical protein
LFHGPVHRTSDTMAVKTRNNHYEAIYADL